MRETNVKNVNETKSEEKKKETTCYPLHYNEKNLISNYMLYYKQMGQSL